MIYTTNPHEWRVKWAGWLPVLVGTLGKGNQIQRVYVKRGYYIERYICDHCRERSLKFDDAQGLLEYRPDRDRDVCW